MKSRNEGVSPDEAALARALASGRPVVVERLLQPAGTSRRELERLLPELPMDAEGAFALASPAHSALLVGRGEADVVELAAGEGLVEAFAAVAARSPLVLGERRSGPPTRPAVQDAMAARGHLALDEAARSGARYVGGLAFSSLADTGAGWEPFGRGRFVLPRVALEHRADGSLIRRDAFAPGTELTEAWGQIETDFMEAGEGDPGAPAWRVSLEARDGLEGFAADVACALEAIEAGRIHKVVLARRSLLSLRRAPGASCLFTRMRTHFPGCHHFLVQRPGGRTFLGATPERLASLSPGLLRTMALAGSASPEEGAQERLLASEKDLAEHQIVVDSIRQRLEAQGGSVRAPSSPGVLDLANVLHLHTPVEAAIAERAALVRAAASLHPTPAVGGRPSTAALAFIQEREGGMRGWYAAPVGWIGCEGDAELVVALRSALVQGDQALLFAGAGIVEGSDPASEYRETELKMEAMRMLLQGGE